jgi:hypothetical protein
VLGVLVPGMLPDQPRWAHASRPCLYYSSLGMLLHCFRASLLRCSYASLLQTFVCGVKEESSDSSGRLRWLGLNNVFAPRPPERLREPRGSLLSRTPASALDLGVRQHLQAPPDELIGDLRAPASAAVSEEFPNLGEAAAPWDAPRSGLHTHRNPVGNAEAGRYSMRLPVPPDRGARGPRLIRGHAGDGTHDEEPPVLLPFCRSYTRTPLCVQDGTKAPSLDDHVVHGVGQSGKGPRGPVQVRHLPAPRPGWVSHCGLGLRLQCSLL